jgi:hypothetical protein
VREDRLSLKRVKLLASTFLMALDMFILFRHQWLVYAWGIGIHMGTVLFVAYLSLILLPICDCCSAQSVMYPFNVVCTILMHEILLQCTISYIICIYIFPHLRTPSMLNLWFLSMSCMQRVIVFRYRNMSWALRQTQLASDQSDT